MNIRNFCIIAHIDHGKSTLADRLIEFTHTVEKRDMEAQILDTMDIERERGITIKLQPIRMYYEYSGDNPKISRGEKFMLNLIDTPGHVDFSYEVSRSLAACEGAILVVDATQGIQAQTLANCYMAIENDLAILPVLNKIDLPAADPEGKSKEIETLLGIPASEILHISAKDGTNVDKLLDLIVEKFPEPKVLTEAGETKALVFDSVYDNYKGIVAYVRLFEGSLKAGDKCKFLHTGAEMEILEVGCFRPKYVKTDILHAGEVGYVVTGLKSVNEARVGDTVWRHGCSVASGYVQKPTPIPGYKKVVPYVFASIFCSDGSQYPMLRDALEKLSLNDSALSFEPENSVALGNGFRCGFLGLLHMDIVQERLEREYDLDLVVTAPSVSYKVVSVKNEEITIQNPSQLPEKNYYHYIKEPWVHTEIVSPSEYMGSIMQLIEEKRGIFKTMKYIDEKRVILEYEIPLANIVIDFYDRLKSLTSGYASMNYDLLDYREGDLVKVDILIAGEKVDALAMILHKNDAERIGRAFCEKLKDIIPRANFVIAIQAIIGGKVIARESISAMRKDVTAKLYGGDVTRKNKLLEKQKKGKKRMKAIGKIDLPQEAFLAVLKRD
ncbi:MAG: GTP-binding protein LepA, GTP-binding protein LepA [Candidatus Peregrinibacteria bacterium GW2011_GWF2_33_10]|nr:MAG: GTP-binding protein LepA, GTP-binding protein LepA [Candidatus Peregrinibacteria bacterium GW2011_GWF2_33_10]OGJ45315.1 MAG: elongation factor 4 [Candidatus Peregrinibacteria bacterium RIFOXYA12_FULL_33_12]OGJ45393.1 MAG: elongation factor 4 [Candidatus Peregrinibacteria bacterium RIFOXYA2_FULL_33_21]OGJ50996.1 MAG: elongation factor 4 [Candidatus Peregrinibacteria bacterium RIFOXYB2_FULL_33_20]